MPLTAQQLNNIANQALDFYIKNEITAQTIQDRPALKAFRGGQKSFPGGKGEIKGNVKGTYTTEWMGYEFDDTVTYANPANVKQFSYPYKELHTGISITFSELKRDGITVVDSLTGENTSQVEGREMTAITGILEDKLDDMKEGSERSLNDMLWRDGTQSAKVFAGIQHFISDDPTTGVVGGIDRATNDWWRNRALTGGSKITHSTSSQTLTKTLRSEVRQLKRYGGRPSLILCGSNAIERLESEIHEKGTYTQTGFVNKGATDIGMADISMRGVGSFQYDPTLDDLGLDDFIYMIDPRHLYFMVMSGEDMKTHAPARPPEKYVLYRAVTWTGGMVCRKMNCHGIYETA